jgi:hypothetical protein
MVAAMLSVIAFVFWSCVVLFVLGTLADWLFSPSEATLARRREASSRKWAAENKKRIRREASEEGRREWLEYWRQRQIAGR